MRALRAVVAAVGTVAAGLWMGCSEEKPAAPVAPAHASLGGDVARVGSMTIPASLVARVAAAQGVSPRAALEMLVDDALAAEGARARGMADIPAVRFAATAANARAIATRLRADALAAGPPTDDEVAQQTAVHWIELDLPEQVRVVHAVVRHNEGMSPEQIARARAVAADILAAVASASTPEEFMERANGVAHAGVEVVVQPLPPFVADGRVAQPGAPPLYPRFAVAAFALEKPGATSPVVESEAGWHLIRLVERLPGRRVPLEDRRALLRDEIIARRAVIARDALLARLKQAHPVQISPAAEATMSLVSGTQ
jgi:hypothetical protein